MPWASWLKCRRVELLMNSSHGSEAWLMPSGVDYAIASCCRRRQAGNAGGTASPETDARASVQAEQAEQAARASVRAEQAEQDARASVQAWRRLVRHLRRVRQLQRIFGYLGQALQWYPANLRDRLRSVDPTDYQRRHGAGRR
jgi:hypothetical protein